MMLCYFALGLAADYSVGLIRLLRPYKASRYGRVVSPYKAFKDLLKPYKAL